jgi:hypothetical protein
MRGDQAGGAAVEISKQVAAQAEAGEVLLTNPVMDLVSGSDVVFTDRGAGDIKSISERCRLFFAVLTPPELLPLGLQSHIAVEFNLANVPVFVSGRRRPSLMKAQGIGDKLFLSRFFLA